MNKSKISVKPILRFLRELAVVVTGIAITVSIGFWVNNINNEKDLKQYLLSVKYELEENARTFDYEAKLLQKSARYERYLHSTDEKSLNMDSIIYYSRNNFTDINDSITYESGYGYGFSYIQFPVDEFTTNAFEMLKSSGVMRQIKDRELLSSIWKTYTYIEVTKRNLDRAFRRKEEELMKEISLILDLFVHGKGKIFAPMKNFYTIGFPQEMVRWCKGTSRQIKETLSMLENY